MRSNTSNGDDTIPFRITDPERIPAERYYDEEFYRLEVTRLWPRVWQMACRLEQIENDGDFVEYQILDKSIIIVRCATEVRAFHNACRHRGVKLVTGHGNCKGRGFICPFHGWRWRTDGRNTFVYGRHLFSERALSEQDLALKRCRVEIWGGCVFVNLDEDAPPLLDCLGPVAKRLEKYQVSKLRAEWWYATVLPANWKIAMEAFMEGYHTMRTHPQLHSAKPDLFHSMYGRRPDQDGPLPDASTSLREQIKSQIDLMELLCEGMAGMCHAKDVEAARALVDVEIDGNPDEAIVEWYRILNAEVTRRGRARGEPTPDLNALQMSDPLRGVEYLFPHYFLLPNLSSFASYRVRPLGPESCLFELWSLTLFPEGSRPPPVLEPTMLPHDSKTFPPIPQQDYANIPLQQLGLHGGGFEFMRLSKAVEGLISNYQRVIDGYLRRTEPDKLTRATAALGGTFDGPIIDLDL